MRWLGALTVAVLVGFAVLISQTNVVVGALSALRAELLPRTVNLETASDPLELSMNQEPCATITKVDSEGNTVELGPICREVGESWSEFGVRVKQIKMEFCKGFE